MFLIFLLFVALFADDKIFIKGGEYFIPYSKGFYTHSFKSKKIKIDSFYIDKYEMSYDRLPKNMKNLIPTYILQYGYKEDLALPVTNITYKQALEVCKKMGGDLPTENEWIVAAAFDKKFYPYATKQYPLAKNDINIKKQYSLDGYMPQIIVSVYNSLIGNNSIFGMLGNVWEMTKSDGKYVLVKGGSFFDYDKVELLDVRVRNYVLKKDVASRLEIGFRCVYKVKK